MAQAFARAEDDGALEINQARIACTSKHFRQRHPFLVRGPRSVAVHRNGGISSDEDGWDGLETSHLPPVELFAKEPQVFSLEFTLKLLSRIDNFRAGHVYDRNPRQPGATSRTSACPNLKNLLDKRGRDTFEFYAYYLGVADQKLNVLVHSPAPNAFFQVVGNFFLNRLKWQCLAFYALLYLQDMETIAAANGDWTKLPWLQLKKKGFDFRDGTAAGQLSKASALLAGRTC